jgi:hypothetical protein
MAYLKSSFLETLKKFYKGMVSDPSRVKRFLEWSGFAVLFLYLEWKDLYTPFHQRDIS